MSTCCRPHRRGNVQSKIRHSDGEALTPPGINALSNFSAVCPTNHVPFFDVSMRQGCQKEIFVGVELKYWERPSEQGLEAGAAGLGMEQKALTTRALISHPGRTHGSRRRSDDSAHAPRRITTPHRRTEQSLYFERLRRARVPRHPIRRLPVPKMRVVCEKHAEVRPERA
jgi:hypothetical protein